MDFIFEKLPSVNNCCYFFPPEKGCTIIGYLGVIYGTLAFIGDAVSIAQLVELSKVHTTTELASAVRLAIGIEVFDLLVLVFFVIISALLILGIRKKNTKFMLVWLYGTLVIIALRLIIGIILISKGYIGDFFSCFFFIGLEAYYIIVVNSYKVDLETGADVNY